MRAIEDVHLLRAFRYKNRFVADSGKQGYGGGKIGSGGKAFVIDVPVGTIVRLVGENGEREELADFVQAGEEYVVAKGGRGGKGNIRYSNAQNQEPLLAEVGEEPAELILELEVHLLADVAIVGKPSVGKSSLLRASSRARPDVAEYPFTTLEPVLGFVERKGSEYVMVEVPGLIEGAHRGAGLGDEFLRHVQRTTVVVYLLDGSSNDVGKDYRQVRQEMGLHDPALLEKPELVVVNKLDIPEVRENIESIKASLGQAGLKANFISAASGEGTGELLDRVGGVVAEQRRKAVPRVREVPVVIPRPRRERVRVAREGAVFVVKSPVAERLVNRVDLGDSRVQIQLWRALEHNGVAKALARAGAKSGSRVWIGKHELEWK